MELLNLDKLVLEDKKIIHNGRTWIVPAEIPTKTTLKIMKCQQLINADPLDSEALSTMMDAIYDLFKIRNQSLNREEFDTFFSITQASKIIEFIFADPIEKKTDKAMEGVGVED